MTMRKELLPALSSLLFLCVLLESTSLLLFSTRVGKKYLPGLWSMDCDASWRSRWEMRHVGKMLPDPYKYDVYDPHRGWALKPSLADLRLPKGNTLTTNSKGTRGAKEYRYGKSEKQRILILGDSFTFGEDVSDKETYSHYLQEMLPFTEVINFGVHGYGHDQMLLYLKEEGLKYKPDLVILGFVDQDMSRNLLAFRDYSKPKYELAHSGLVLENYPVPPPEAVLGSGRFRPGAVDLLVILYYGLKHRLGLEKKETEEITAAILNELAVQARNMGAIPLVHTSPRRRTNGAPGRGNIFTGILPG